MSTPRHQEPAPPATDPKAFRAIVEGRRSVRKFLADPIPEDVLQDCLDLTLLAPNSSNLQPWEFVVVRSAAARAKLAHACMDQNAAKTAPVLIVALARTNTWRENAQWILDHWPVGEPPKLVQQYYGKLVKYHYAVGMFGTFGLAKRAINGAMGLIKPAPRGPYTPADMRLWAAKTTALACENLMLAARAHGFDTCPMEGFDEARVRDVVPMADDACVVMIVAMGKRAAGGVYYPRQRLEQKHVVRYL